MINVMNDEKYNLLVSLSQRKYPGTIRWYSNPKHCIGDYGTSICLICNQEIYLSRIDFARGYDFAPMRNHGEQHLKDSNLLPFL